MDANCAAARHLAALVDKSDLFRLASPAPLNIVCFTTERPEANRALVEALHLEGVAAPSLTLIGGNPVIRCALFNHRTEIVDVDTFFAKAEALAQQLIAHECGG